MKTNILLASTSTLYGEQYLSYLTPELLKLFVGIEELLFIPFARPGGISMTDYTLKVSEFFKEINIAVKSLHQFPDPAKAINDTQAFFTGGGNTFLLVKTLHDLKVMDLLRENINAGKPYLGCSAGSNIGGVNMKTTNDMPIVYPSSFDCMALVPFNINAHYLDPQPDLKHNGETRETRINEFLTQNKTKVVGLREGNWIRKIGNKITTEGTELTRIFENDKAPYEIAPGTQIK